MPTSDSILQGLDHIANHWMILAIAWHAFFAVLAFVPRLPQRTRAICLALPLWSVSGLAWLHRNPFNGAGFLVLGLVLLLIGVRMPVQPAHRGARWMQAAGWVMFAFGWVYPHFLQGKPAAAYLIAAPTGIVPCPTLAMLIGLTLIHGGLGSRTWGAILALAGSFYGLFGVVRLGVGLDWALVFGAGALASANFQRPKSWTSPNDTISEST